MLKFFTAKNWSSTLLLMLFLAMGLGVLAPLFSDEIVIMMAQTRLFYDHGNAFFCMPQCFTESWKIQVSEFNIPYKVFESLFYNLFPSPLIIRIGAILIGWLLVYLFYCFTIRATKRAELSRALTLCIFSLGISPLLFVFNRPEQELLLVVIAECILFLRATSESRNHGLASELGFFFIHTSLLLIAYAAHPNVVHLTPLFLFISWQLAEKRIIKWLAILVVALLATDAFLFNSLYYSCPNDPYIRAFLQRMAVRPQLIFENFPYFLEQVITNLSAAPSYIRNMGYSANYPYNWAPKHVFSIAHLASNILSYIALGSIALLSFFGLCCSLLKLAKGQKLEKLSQLSIAIYFSIFCLLSFQITKNWYSSAFVIPVIAVSAILFWDQWKNLITERLLHLWAIFIFFAATFSMLLYFCTFLLLSPPKFYTLNDPLFLDTKPVTGNLTFSGFNYEQTSAEIWAAAAQCGFSKEGKYHRLAVDDVTYWALRKSEDPLHLFYLNRIFGESTNTAFYASSIGSLEHFLRDRGSDGIIARCDEVIEPTLRKKAKQLGHFCCWDFRNK